MESKEELEQQDKSNAKTSSDKTLRSAWSDLSIVQTSTIVYAIMAAVGAIVAIYFHSNLFAALAMPEKPLELVAIAGLSVGILLIASYLCESWFPSFQDLKNSMTSLLGPTPWWAAVYLALVSSVGEELLFRAAIMPYTGLVISSIIFGLLHLDPDRGISSWTLWAFAAGLLLGWMYEATGSLYPSLVAHFVVNLVSILRLQYLFRTRAARADAG